MQPLKALLIQFVVFRVTYCRHEDKTAFPKLIRSRIDTLIEGASASANISAYGLSVVKWEGEIQRFKKYSKSYGFEDIENRVKANKKTLYAIGSVTKSFTAAVILRTLYETFPNLGVALLNEPIRNIAPGFDFVLNDKYRTDQTTLRDLMAHRVCIEANTVGHWVMAYDRKEYFYRQRYASTNWGFREGKVYSNALYALAADIVAHMANTTYENLLMRFLKDIGMRATTIIRMDDDHNNMGRRSIPYIFKDGHFIRYESEMLKQAVLSEAASAILSSPQDMEKYLEFHLNGGKVRGEEIIPAIAWKHITWVSNLESSGVLRTSFSKSEVIDVKIGYALGHEVGIYDGWLRYGHGGFLPPYDCLMQIYPNAGVGLFTIVSGPGTLSKSPYANENVHNALFDIIQEKSIRSSPTNPKSFYTSNFPVMKVYFPKDEGENQLHIAQSDIVGSYGSGYDGDLKISLQQNDRGDLQPYLIWGRFGKGWLQQVSPSNFSITWTTDFWMFNWSMGEGMWEYIISFMDKDTFKYLENGLLCGNMFTRNTNLTSLPAIPWKEEISVTTCSKQ